MFVVVVLVVVSRKGEKHVADMPVAIVEHVGDMHGVMLVIMGSAGLLGALRVG